MKAAEKARLKLDQFNKMDNLSVKDLDKLVIIRPLSKRQKAFLLLWRNNNNVMTIAKELKCSRALVYNLISNLYDYNIVETPKKSTKLA